MSKAESKKVSILYIEDNPGDVELIKAAFEIIDVDILLAIAQDGDIALKMLALEDEYIDLALPDIILLDLNLPKKDGIELLKELKSRNDCRHIPVIIYTSSKSSKDVNETYSNYAAGYVVKPYGKDSLAAMASAILDFWADAIELPKCK